MRVLDAKPVNVDGFSVTNPELGLVAMRSPYDPEPSLVVRGRVVVELDGKAAEDFDVIDEFIARTGWIWGPRGRRWRSTMWHWPG
jgi:propanediol dehydratase large subunit